jgi:hypothetical protein
MKSGDYLKQRSVQLSSISAPRGKQLRQRISSKYHLSLYE